MPCFEGFPAVRLLNNQLIKQTFELLAISDIMTLMWSYWNDVKIDKTPITRAAFFDTKINHSM